MGNSGSLIRSALWRLIVPLVLFTWVRGLRMEVEQHRRIARWTWPIWLYVTFTGVVVYFMIAPYYPA